VVFNLTREICQIAPLCIATNLYDVVEYLPEVGLQATFAQSIPLPSMQHSRVFLRRSSGYWLSAMGWKFGVHFSCTKTVRQICMVWLSTYPRSDCRLLSHNLYLCHRCSKRESFYVDRADMFECDGLEVWSSFFMHQDRATNLYDMVEYLPEIGLQATFAQSIPLASVQHSRVFLRQSSGYWLSAMG